MRGLRALSITLAALAALIAIGHCSGSQPDRDAVAAAERELGIELESRHVDVGDVRLYVVLAGPADGELVVLLHGFPEFWYAWARPLALLAAQGFRVAVPDQRGYGRSDKPRDVASYRVELLAADLANLVRGLGFERACFAAHDWGGRVAWQLAIDNPDVVRKLAVIDTPHPQAGERVESQEETIAWYRTFFQLPWLPEWTARVGNWYVTSSMLRDTSLPGAFPDQKLDLYRSAWDHEGAFGTMVNWYRAAFRYAPTFQGEQRISVPTLVLVAPDDAFIPADVTKASAYFLDAGHVVELERGTHWVVQEDPERVALLLADFCR